MASLITKADVVPGKSTNIMSTQRFAAPFWANIDDIHAHMYVCIHFSGSVQFFDHVLEAEWAVEVLKESGKPVLATVCIGPEGDADSFSPEQCALRLARAGADVVGVNCRFGPQTCLKTVAMMKRALKLAKLDHVYLAVQPYGYHTPDAPINGYSGMKEFPFGENIHHDSNVQCCLLITQGLKL